MSYQDLMKHVLSVNMKTFTLSALFSAEETFAQRSPAVVHPDGTSQTMKTSVVTQRSELSMNVTSDEPDENEERLHPP